MTLEQCVSGLNYRVQSGRIDVEITDVVQRSTQVTPGTLFIAVNGFTVDGHAYIEHAIAGGAAAVLIESSFEVKETQGVTVISVEDTRRAMGHVAANFFEHPTASMRVTGITGTNGKTSISYFIRSILERTGRRVGVIGTMGTLIDGRHVETAQTTPDAITLQRLFRDMLDAGVTDVVMEVSSHALELERISGCRFDTALFTNLTPDHMELHGDMAHYYQAKKKLFTRTEGTSVICVGDAYGRRLIQELNRDYPACIGYGAHPSAHVRACEVHRLSGGSHFTAETPEGAVQVSVHLPGDIYVDNALGALAWALASNINLKTAAEGIAAVEGIKGRFETVYADHGRRVIVDFAHTEDGLEQALKTLKPFTEKRLILVFGVYTAALRHEEGADKRRAMGAVAAKYADFSVVTSDNPKKLDPQRILDEVAAAVETAGGAYTAILERRAAIEYALEMMAPGDVVLLSGKGHETAQAVGGVDVPFNEGEIVRETMRRLERDGAFEMR